MRPDNLARYAVSHLRTLSYLLVTSVVAVAAAPVAGSTYTVSGEADEHFNLTPFSSQLAVYGGSQDTSSGPLSDGKLYHISGTYPGDYLEVINQDSAAGPGAALHASASAVYERDYVALDKSGFYDNVSNHATAMATFNDVVISGPQGATSIATTINMHLDGTISATSTTSVGSNNVFADSSVSATLIFGTNQVIGDGQFSSSSNQGSFATTSGSGWLTNFNGNSTLTSGSFMAPVNTPFTLTFELVAGTTTGMDDNNSGLATASAEFGNTFSFAVNQSVFNLPAGYTANSVSGNLINNSFVPTPEPASAVLAVIGFAMFALRRRPVR